MRISLYQRADAGIPPEVLPEIQGERESMTNIIIVGECEGVYSNSAVSKEFEAKVLVSVRDDGTVIVHNLKNGVRPLCYINDDAEISITREEGTVKLSFLATTEEGERLELNFKVITTLQGIPNENEGNSLALNVLQCVSDMAGKYGRSTIARVLTGSVSKKILTIKLDRLKTYGTAKDVSMKEVLATIDWLIGENYIAYEKDSEFPILKITDKGIDILNGRKELEAKQ